MKNNIKKNTIATFFDSLANKRSYWISKNTGFHSEDIKMLKEIIPKGKRVLELGCGNGHVLDSLQPSVGVGIDISTKMILEAKKKYVKYDFKDGDIHGLENIIKDQHFDFILISDTIGYLNNVQDVLSKIHSYCTPQTRLIVSYFSPFWSPILSMATYFKCKMPDLDPPLFSTSDITNFLNISNFETVRIEKKILLPIKFFGLERLINRFIAVLPLVSHLCLRQYLVSRSLKVHKQSLPQSASIIIPVKNESGNIKNAIKNIPKFSKNIEIIFVEGNSDDNTWSEIQSIIKSKVYEKKGYIVKAFKQKGKGKGDAVFYGFSLAQNDVLMILDGDLTVPPEELKKFWDLISTGEAEFINGSRLIYPLDDNAMRLLNYIANKIFSHLFTWTLGQRYTDTLCGTKVIRRRDYESSRIANLDLERFDPFGDFYLIFSASRMSLKMIEVPIRYKARTFGVTQISRFSHGFQLLKMLTFAFFKIKAI